MDDGLLGSGRPESFSARLREKAKSGELWDGLALAFNSLRMRPDPQIAQMAQAGQARRDDMQSRNRTAEWLRSQGMGKYADAIEAGGMTAPQAMQLAQREQEMAMAAARGPEATAMQRNYEFLIAQGMSPEQALEAVRVVIEQYPESEYAQPSKLKFDLAFSHLAAKEMEVGRYYLKSGHYGAAVNRFRVVVEDFQTTSQTPEALHRLVEAYLSLGLVDF